MLCVYNVVFIVVCAENKVYAIVTMAAQQSVIVILGPLSILFDSHRLHDIVLKHTQLRLKRHFHQFIFLCVLVGL